MKAWIMSMTKKAGLARAAQSDSRWILSARSPRDHRGVVLLVVLILLSLFLVIATTFLLLAGSYRRAAQSLAREEWYGTPPQRLLDEAVYQLVRGTRDPNSVLAASTISLVSQSASNKSECLLADLYGYDGFVAYGAIESIAGNRIRFHVPVPEVNPSAPFPHNSPASGFVQGDFVLWRDVRNRQKAYFAQQVPPGTTTSVQAPFIFGYYVNQYLTVVDVLPNPMMPNVPPPEPLRLQTLPIVHYALRTNNSPPTPPAPFSDLPVHSGGTYANQYVYAEIDVTWPTNSYQHASLDTISGLAVGNVVRLLVNGRPFNGDPGNPQNQTPGDAKYPDEQYDYPDDNNRFLAHADPTRQHPSFAFLNGPLVVDNDRDGIPDSLFVDLGMPVMTGADGRQVKPLFAIKCIDLDGRLNVNFAGNRGHLRVPQTWTIVQGDPAGPAGRYRPSRAVSAGLIPDLAYGNPVPSPAFGQGVGWGVADITLWDALTAAVQQWNSSLSPGQVAAVAAAWYGQLLDMRYAAMGRPGIPQDDSTVSLAAQLKFPTYRMARSLVDFHAALRQGMDPRGMPAAEPVYSVYPPDPYDPIIDSPYELHTDAPRGQEPGSADHLFSLSELESLLRYYDWDVHAFPSRLRTAFFDINGDNVPDPLPLGETALFRQSVTTESWDIPVLRLRGQRRDSSGNPIGPIDSPMELLAERIRDVDINNIVNPATIEDLVLRRVVPPEFVFGMPMDLNRALPEWPAGATSLNDPRVQLYYRARQEMAQQLYLLMLLVSGEDPTAPDPHGEMNKTMADRIAQWALNVVDFRDGDAIMTPFEYDTNPFDGWGVDGNPFDATENQPFPGTLPPPAPQPTQRKLVWGCERPELLITEAFGWHDVRVRKSGMNYEQLDRPRGYFFVELYNPWASPVFQSDLNRWGLAPPAGVQLNARTASGEPIWRLEIVSKYKAAPNRTVYFTPPGGNAPRPFERTYYSDLVNQPVYLLPGHYGVIGSVGWVVDPSANGFNADIDNDGNLDFVSPLGLPNPTTLPPALDYRTVRRIQLSRSPWGAQLVRLDGFTAFPKPVVAIPVNRYLDATGTPRWRSLNVSEPYDGYAAQSAGQPVVEPMEQRYANPPNSPFDEGNIDDGKHIANGNIWPTDQGYSDVDLQRLANPFLPFDPVINPYQTVDHFHNGSLTRINGAATDPPSNSDVQAQERSDPWLWRNTDLRLSDNDVPIFGGTHYYSGAVKSTLGFLNFRFHPYETNPLPAAVVPAGLPADYYVGAPVKDPFPLLTWLNRPLLNQYELLDVPATNSEELVEKYQPPSTYKNPNDTHLLPIIDYRSDNDNRDNGDQDTSIQFYHILYFTRARSPFLGAETFLNPNDPTDIFPRREPGRININTMPNASVWLGLWNGVEVPEGQSGNLTRSWVPLFAEIRPERNNPARPHFPPALGTAINTDTLLWTFADNNNNPRGLKNWPNSSDGFFYMDGSLHTYYRFHGLNRIGGEITTTSNVFAVWITVGFFDLDPATGQVAGEHGADTGEQKRHRAFYIIDRSVPVAFEPGENHNVDRAILLRRFIE